jgi:hypothetical protein
MSGQGIYRRDSIKRSTNISVGISNPRGINPQAITVEYLINRANISSAKLLLACDFALTNFVTLCTLDKNIRFEDGTIFLTRIHLTKN